MEESQTDNLKNPNITEAKIVEAQGRTGAKTAWHSVIIDLTLEIHLPDVEPYTVESTWLVKIFKVQHLQVNNLISVQVDAENPKVIYPVGGGYELWEAGEA